MLYSHVNGSMPAPNRAADPYRQYRDNQILTSSPVELVVMLFDGALRFVRRTAAALEQKDHDEAHLYLGRTQQIITELSASLDFTRGELSRNLFSLYEYINFQLLKADLRRDTAPLKEVEEMLLSLRESWVEAGRLSARSAKIENRKDGSKDAPV